MKKLLIIGCGFAGISAVRKLSSFRKDFQVTVIDKKPTFDFLPLIPDCFGSGINPDYLEVSISDFSKMLYFDFINEEVKSLDLENAGVKTTNNNFNYDFLLIPRRNPRALARGMNANCFLLGRKPRPLGRGASLASGSQANFFGNEIIKKSAFTLSSVFDCRKIKQALKTNSSENFVISGGGYTGIEAATNLRVYLEKKL